MGLDIACAALVATFLVLGLLSGFLAQVVRLAALVGAFVLSHPAGSYARPLLMKWMDVENLMGDLLSLFLGFLASYIAILLTGKIVVRVIRNASGSIKILDRMLGGGLGAAKGFLIVYLIACAIVLLRGPLQNLLPEKTLDLQNSRLAAFAEQHNVLARIGIPNPDKLKEITSAAGDAQRRPEFLRRPEMNQLKQNQTFQRLMNDKDFQEAVDRKHWSAILNNRNFREAINDPEIRKILSTLDLKGLSEAHGTE